MPARKRLKTIEHGTIQRRASPLLVALALSGCVSYHAERLEPLSILRELEQVALVRGAPAAPGDPAGPRAAQVTARQAAGWAVTHNPKLVAVRAELGIAEAELVRAGLLPNPVIGWDSMNVVGAAAGGLTPKTPEYVAGLALGWEVPRPGEIGAKVGSAQARKESVRLGILAAEWRLVRAVHQAYAEVIGASARLDLNARILEIARRTAEFFEEARAVGGATSMQQSLAVIALSRLEQQRIQLEGKLLLARQRINQLLGLPPMADVDWLLPADPFTVTDADFETEELVEHAMNHRPDLHRLLASYQAAEEELRLEIARQWPQLTIGTAFALVIPIFNQFNRPAVNVAIARRERIAREVRAAIHAVRAEAHAAVTALHYATRQVRSFQANLVPQVKESLRLTDEAFRVREVTLIEILTAQTQVLDAGNQYLDARIRAFQARILVDTVTGDVLADEFDQPEERTP